MEPLKHIICLEIIQLYCNLFAIVLSTNRLNNNCTLCDLQNILKYVEVVFHYLLLIVMQRRCGHIKIKVPIYKDLDLITTIVLVEISKN